MIFCIVCLSLEALRSSARDFYYFGRNLAWAGVGMYLRIRSYYRSVGKIKEFCFHKSDREVNLYCAVFYESGAIGMLRT